MTEPDWSDVVGGILRRHELLSCAESIAAAERDKNLSGHFAAIREIYRINHDEILAGRYDPYLIDWQSVFTPIEDDAWFCIRSLGLPFFPQYPVLNYFLDFADPIKRIALELDGKAFHNPAKDLIRDNALVAIGWKVFRVKGSEAHACHKSPDELIAHGEDREYELEYGRRLWLFQSVEGVLASIRYVYYLNQPDKYDGDCLMTLNQHRLADFPLVDE